MPHAIGSNHPILRKIESGQLKVSQPDDKYELEADRAAQQVMRVPNTQAIQRKSSCSSNRAEEFVEGHTVSGIQSLLGNGSPLPTSQRRLYESRFGNDFSDVRIHTGSRATELARVVNARAFTVGRDIVFASGEYEPQTHEGKRLLAHEMAHVTQQRQYSNRGTNRVALSFSAPIIVQRKPLGPMQESEWKPLMKKNLRFASTRAHVAANRLANQTLLAAKEFEAFASERISDLEDQIKGSEVVESLVAVFPGTFTAMIAGKVASEFGKSFINEIGKQIEGKLTDAVRNGKGLEDSVEDLEKAVLLIPSAARDNVSILPGFVKERFDKPADEIIEKLENDKRLSAKDALFARDFLMAGEKIGPIDKAIEDNLGLPGPDRATEYHVALYRNWVTRFSEMWLIAKATTHQHIHAVTSSMKGAGRYTFKSQAARIGQSEAKKRAKELRIEPLTKE